MQFKATTATMVTNIRCELNPHHIKIKLRVTGTPIHTNSWLVLLSQLALNMSHNTVTEPPPPPTPTPTPTAAATPTATATATTLSATSANNTNTAEYTAWKQVHQQLVNSILIQRDAISIQKAQRRYWLTEINANLTPDGKLTSNSVWKKPGKKRGRLLH